MMQPELLNSFSPFGTQIMDLDINNLMGDLEFPSPLLCGDSRIFSPTFNLASSFWSSEFTESQSWDKELLFELPNGEFQLDMNDPEQYACSEADRVSIDSIPSQKYCTANFNEASPCSVLCSSQMSMMNASSVQSSQVLHTDENGEFSLFHLLKAYAEATEREQATLMEVIQRCISDKASPVGETMERLAFNLFKTSEPQYSYIIQESQVNVEVAKKALYNLFPYGRLAHLAANSAILEAIPADAKTVNIVDFDIGDGVQWAPLIDTLGHQKRELTLIFVKWAEDGMAGPFSQCNPANTRKRLISYAGAVGAKLKVHEVEIDDLVNEIKRKNKRCAQWFSFNCMISLPHMIESRSKAKVHEFLRVAKDVIGDSTNGGNRGIITFGDGEADMQSTNLSNYSLFFERQVIHYQALLKSVECIFSDKFIEAKVAIECLFLSPRISSHDWLQKWEDTNKGGNVQATIGLEGLQLSQNTLMEANVLVRGSGNSYNLRMGQDANEMVLEWRGMPLVKLSTWR